MPGPSVKKRSFSDGPKSRAPRPTKKQRQIAAYHSSSDESEDDSDAGAAVPANLLDSDDEDLENVEVDDGASSQESNSDSDSQSETESTPKRNKLQSKHKPKTEPKKLFVAKDAPASSGDDENNNDDDADSEKENDGEDEDEGDDDDEYSDLSDAASHTSSSGGTHPNRNTKSKRNDPAAFATSISKMLSSKLPTSRRADPIVARSAAAAEQSRQAVDAALEAKARRRLREQKRLALEKGRVRDVLVASTTRTLNIATGEIEEVADAADGTAGGAPVTTAEIMAGEKRLRKVAQRGVVKLFNAVRVAQVKATEAERAARKEGIVGTQRKGEKVTEMSRKGFLDLIASGGGGLKKGGLEEA
ncbi:Rrp15p-domain-containing protein [Dichotomopilus funicola]|uniref:Rrp15p-domain-containing protein n=1 Tax=Dichotomopilus funicola TaxID=1934379 RepID=A0AAN6ZLY7_9PEZI|nr:Rrp15p-domain-containing protein [Dichotomopilus funicola]